MRGPVVRTGQPWIYGEVERMATEGLQKTLEFIKDNPTEWDQQRWHMCFAGVALRVVKGAT
jgi:hypothetical protein